ncbi:MAG TPA: hypothetical protein VGB95_01310 [Chitinophagales bacterium]
MKNLKVLLAAMLLAISVNFATAQTAPKAAAKTETKSETKRPNADGRTKTGDKINKSLKGPNGETVYTGPKGGNYYLDKKDNKVYLK